VDDEKAELGHVLSPVSIFHGHVASDALPVPAARWLLTRAARFFEQEGPRAVLLAPRLQLLAYRTRARDERDQAYTLLEAQPERAFTVGLTVGHNAAHSREAERQALLNRYRGLCAVTGIAIAHAHAEWEALTAHAKTQEHLLEIIMPIFAVPIGRARRDWPVAAVGLLLISPIEGDRRRILVQPGGREGIDLQGIERDRAKHTIQIHSKQRIEDLP